MYLLQNQQGKKLILTIINLKNNFMIKGIFQALLWAILTSAVVGGVVYGIRLLTILIKTASDMQLNCLIAALIFVVIWLVIYLIFFAPSDDEDDDDNMFAGL